MQLLGSAATLDATQEMLTLGICNIVGSFVGSMPTCGALIRSAISHASGIRTPLAGIYSAIMTLLALSILTPYFYFIPQATLASILIVASAFTVVALDFYFLFSLICHSSDRFRRSIVFVA